MKSLLRRMCVFDLAVLIVLCAGASHCGEIPAPQIPPKYVSEVVLHVEYGTGPDKVGVEWGGACGEEYEPPASATNLRVVGGRFYLIDATSAQIKVFRPRGTLVWASEPLQNVQHYAVDSEGRVYVVWGSGSDRLSYLDAQGNLIWTRREEEMLPKETLEELGLRSKLPGLGWVEWTVSGLALTVIGTKYSGEQEELAVLLNGEGRSVGALPGKVVGSDGTVYDFRIGDRPKDRLSGPVVGKDRKGKILRNVIPDFEADNGVHLAGYEGMYRVAADPSGGLLVESSARLPKEVRVNSRMTTKLEQVLWRFDTRGRFKEQWRFPSNKFASRASQVVVGSDGYVYHLEFGESGIDVVKYAKAK